MGAVGRAARRGRRVKLGWLVSEGQEGRGLNGGMSVKGTLLGARHRLNPDYG